MFKNVNIYRIAPGWASSLEIMEDALDAHRFVPCSPSQDRSVGWVEPRGEAHGALVESVSGQLVLKFMLETKSVPGDLVRKKAQEEADHIEATTGRKPGKKETKGLREDARLTLLPMAFPKQSSVLVWIDRAAGLLITDASSQNKTDEVITALVRSFDDLQLSLVQTNASVVASMTKWLIDDEPGIWKHGFSVERDGELRSGDEEKSVIKFARHNMATDEVRKHVIEGKLPVRLAMSYDDRIGFTLTEGMQIKKIEFLEGVFDDRARSDESGFDADVALSTGELQKMLPALIAVLGGEFNDLFGG